MTHCMNCGQLVEPARSEIGLGTCKACATRQKVMAGPTGLQIGETIPEQGDTAPKRVKISKKLDRKQSFVVKAPYRADLTRTFTDKDEAFAYREEVLKCTSYVIVVWRMEKMRGILQPHNF